MRSSVFRPLSHMLWRHLPLLPVIGLYRVSSYLQPSKLQNFSASGATIRRRTRQMDLYSMCINKDDVPTFISTRPQIVNRLGWRLLSLRPMIQIRTGLFGRKTEHQRRSLCTLLHSGIGTSVSVGSKWLPE
jgi:hypothetical protein